MSGPASRLDAILADPLREIRAARDGIGHVGADIPLEVLWASGRPVCQLPVYADRATPWADRWLESGFPGWARSVLEDWHAGRFDALGSVVFSRGDDASQRFYYYVCELQRRGELAGPEPLIFDVALIPREASLLRTVASVEKLAAQLDVAADALPQGIERVNRQRRLFAQLQASRGGPGALYEKIARASGYADVAALCGKDVLPAEPRRRILLAGSVPPDDRLHRAVDDVDAAVVAEAHPGGLARLGPEIHAGAAGASHAIAQALTQASVGPRSFIDRAAWLLDMARHSRAHGVVLWLTQQDEALVWQVPAQRALLELAGIPALILTEQRWDADDGALVAIAKFACEVPA